MTKTKKGKRFEIPVSRTNFNRVRYQTHTLVDVLKREGYMGSEGGVLVEGDLIDLNLVDLAIKPEDPVRMPKTNAATH